MKHALKKLLLTSAACMLMTFPAYASECVTSVNIGITEEKPEPGIVAQANIVSNDRKFVIESAEPSRDYDEWKPGSKITFDVTVRASDGYFFSRTKTNVRTGSNGQIVSNPTIASSTVHCRVNYWPKMKLENPTDIYFEDEFTAAWEKVPYAGGYEVKIYQDGKYYRTEKTTRPEIDLGNFATGYAEVTFDVRAVHKDTKYRIPSDWVNCDESVSSGESSVYGKFTGTPENLYFRNEEDGKNSTGWQEINGTWFYFDPLHNGKAFYNEWQFIGGYWFHFNNKAEMDTGWIQLKGDWYYLDSLGHMLTGWYNASPNGEWYYFRPDGVLLRNTTTPDGHWVDSRGLYHADGNPANKENGWKQIGDNWYFHDNGQVVVSQWRNINNNWYYFNDKCEMVRGWNFINDKWYYMYPSGEMATGWQNINEQWFYLDPATGRMLNGWQNVDRLWYYLQPSGQMLTGWQNINNTWYYFNPANGVMETSKYIGDYFVDGSGAWVR